MLREKQSFRILIFILGYHIFSIHSEIDGLAKCQRKCQTVLTDGQMQMCLLDCYQGFSYVMYRTSRSYKSNPDTDEANDNLEPLSTYWQSGLDGGDKENITGTKHNLQRHLGVHFPNKIFGTDRNSGAQKREILIRMAGKSAQRMGVAGFGKRRNGFVRIGRWFEYPENSEAYADWKDDRLDDGVGHQAAETGKRRTGFVRIGLH